jgi:hypothetical protein
MVVEFVWVGRDHFDPNPFVERIWKPPVLHSPSVTTLGRIGFETG